MFTFEHTHQLSEREYVKLFGVSQTLGVASWLRRIGIATIGFALLFWPFTVGLGVVILLIAAVTIFLPRALPGTAARTFRQLTYLSEPATYGANNDRVWVKTSDFSSEVTWRHVTVWYERDGWLILQGSEFPSVLLPIASLKAAGVYDQLKARAKQHAVEFGSVEARLRSAS